MIARTKTGDFQFPKHPERFRLLREEERYWREKLFNWMIGNPFGIPPVIGNPPTMFVPGKVPIYYFCSNRSGYDCHSDCYFPFQQSCMLFTDMYDNKRRRYYSSQTEEEREGLKMEMIQFLRRIKDGINLNYEPFIKRYIDHVS